MGYVMTPVRNTIKGIIEGIPLPHYPMVKEDFPSGPPSTPPPPGVKGRVTNCGAFPGWIIKQLGGRGLPADLSLKFTDQYGTYSLTAPMTGWENWAKKLEEKRGAAAKGTIWIPYKKGIDALPRLGDIYVLFGWTKSEPRVYGFAHVGIVFDVSGDTWTTADTGQGKRGYGGCYNTRTVKDGKSFSHSTDDKQPDSGSRDLRGWVNIDNLLAGWQPS